MRTVITFNVAYDANNRLTSLISASSPGDKFLFQYPSNNFFTLDLYNSGLLNIHEIYYLNSLSFVDSTLQYNNTNDTLTEKNFYNSAKQFITQKQYDYHSTTGAVLINTTTYTYNTNGDALTETDNNGVKKFDYHSNLPGSVPLGIPYSPQPKNLIKTIIYTSGGVTDTVHNFYTFDSLNRLTMEKDTIAGSSDIVIKTYTY